MYQLLPEEALVLDQPLPVNLWDPKGVLLLRRGETVTSAKHREQIMLHSPGVLASEWQAVTYGYTTALDRLVRNNESLSQIAKVSALMVDTDPRPKTVPLSFTESWADLYAALRSLLHQGAEASHFLDRLLRVQVQTEQLWHQQPDNSMLLLVQYLFDPRLSYSTTHALLCAGLCQLVSASSDMAVDTHRRLTQTALTMNLGMTQVQDQLARQATQPSALQRQLIREHPLHSAAILRELGVTDPTWLRWVEEHHERSDGTGYPVGHRADGTQYRLLQLADSFVACISPREDRGSLSSRDLARQLYLGFGETPDPWGALFVKVIGFFPPGSYVRLVNGERGVVVRRGEKANAPKVMALMGRLGTPLGEPALRDTADAAFAVQASLPPGEVKVVVNVERLIARC
jgi:HD-GYP domain-containing protein (c-di-GMP phosphodiesterase class II)